MNADNLVSLAGRVDEENGKTAIPVIGGREVVDRLRELKRSISTIDQLVPDYGSANVFLRVHLLMRVDEETTEFRFNVARSTIILHDVLRDIGEQRASFNRDVEEAEVRRVLRVDGSSVEQELWRKTVLGRLVTGTAEDDAKIPAFMGRLKIPEGTNAGNAVGVDHTKLASEHESIANVAIVIAADFDNVLVPDFVGNLDTSVVNGSLCVGVRGLWGIVGTGQEVALFSLTMAGGTTNRGGLGMELVVEWPQPG
jgi:hypothetical protein